MAQPHFYSLAPTLSPQELSKMWSIAASMRAFYDDNYNTAPRGMANDSFGFEIQPTFSLNLPLEQTYIGFKVDYSYRWYEDSRAPKTDHTINLTTTVNHAFSERYKVSLTDSLALAEEDTILDTSPGVVAPLRTQGTNFRNRIGLDFTGNLTEALSAVLGYANTFYDYRQDGIASRSALLDRLEHEFTGSLRWQAKPTTVVLVGYTFDLTDFTSTDLIQVGVPAAIPPIPQVTPSSRDSLSHSGFVGIDHTFSAQLSGSIRGGYQYSKFPHALPGQSDKASNPYVDASGTWTYTRGSYVQVGVRHSRQKTDIAIQPGSALPTLDQESTVAYGSINHQFTGRLAGGILGQAQWGVFNQGGANKLTEDYYLLGVSLTYRINQYLVAESGYNYDLLRTDITGRGYHRDRIYLGLRAAY